MGLDKTELFTGKAGKEMKQISANGRHNQKNRILGKTGKGHVLPQKVIVHLIKQTLAVPAGIVKPDDFQIT